MAGATPQMPNIGNPPATTSPAARTALLVLEYAQAPTIGFYFLAAFTFGVCTLQKPRSIPVSRRRVPLTLMFTILISHIAEILYYLSCAIAKSDFDTPHDAVINCLGSVLAWTPLSVALYKTNKVRWHPYFGTYLLELGFELGICLALGFEGRVQVGKGGMTPMVLRVGRSLAALALSVDGLILLFSGRGERGTDEEGRGLLSKPGSTNGSIASANGNAGYGAIPAQDNEDDEEEDEEEEGKDPHKDIKALQAKRLQEEGGWYGYLKSFTIFLPYLWPKNDWILMGCLAVRALYVIQGRIFNLLTPRQLGIITDKLASGTHVMPWKDIILWATFSWVNSYSGFGMLSNFADTVIRNRSFARITNMAYKHVMNLSTDFHTNKESGEVLKAVEQASSLNTIIELVLFEIFPILIDMVIAMWYVTHLFDTYMAFIILFMGATYVWFGIYFTTWASTRRRKYMEKQRAENQVINETISNWQTVFYFNRAPYECERYAAAVASTISAHYNHYFRTVGGHVFQDWVMTSGFTACCIFAISQIVAGLKPVGNLVTFIMYWETMMMPLYVVAYSYRTLSNSLIDAERLLQLLNTKPTVVDADDAKELVIKNGNVEFKDVEFAYDERKQILKGVSLKAEGGQTIAFVGETGGGKTTMLKMLSRAYDVTAGYISIDGQDLRSITKSSLIDAIGYVPQDPVLFNRSIRDNIRYGRLDATDEEIVDACRAAAVHDAIDSFPDKYDSKVGERGVQLSGGQLQRIAIARVLLRNPKIVLLDEATSAVDSAIEAQIQDAFRKLSAGRTTFVIAHRLSTIVEADQIIVVEQGQIKERGTHSELLEIGGKYAELWTHQIAGNLSALNSKSGSKAGSTHDGEDGAAAKAGQTEILIDITPAEEDVAKARATLATGSDDNSGSKDKDTSTRKR